jgi:segregation and condensation protein B
MEDDMTDERTEPFQEDDQTSLEQVDKPTEDAESPDEQVVQESPAQEEEPAHEPVDFEEDEYEPAEEQDDFADESEAPAEQTAEYAEHKTDREAETTEDAAIIDQAVEQTVTGEADSEQVPQEQEEQPTSDGREPAQPVLTVESVIEAILFATDEPLTDGRLAGIVETTSKQVRQSIKALNEKYEANNNAFRIEQIAGGYQMLTLNVYNGWLKKMLHARSDSKLSPAALETLAIVAYKQPIIRADIEAVRGVAVGEVIRSLMYKGLVKITGRAEILGRPMLYGTTRKFLEVFGLNSLKDLPKAEELKKPD